MTPASQRDDDRDTAEGEGECQRQRQRKSQRKGDRKTEHERGADREPRRSVGAWHLDAFVRGADRPGQRVVFVVVCSAHRLKREGDSQEDRA